MNRFWTRFIKPILETAAPRRIMEVGADFGWNTGHLLAYCRETGCRLDVVDPAPRPDLMVVLAAYDEEYSYLPHKSLDAIPRAPAPDVVLLDGDHNWHTIHAELHLLFDHAASTGDAPPLVLMHDVAWPYARRDMYYDPEGLRVDQRHAYAHRGLEPGRSELLEGGMNGMLANALVEGGPKNGVLTGIEDFIRETDVELTLHVLPFFNGLGMIVPKARSTPALEALIGSFTEAPSLIETVKALEEAHMRARVDVAQGQAVLTRRTDALVRARALLAERTARIAALEAGLAQLRGAAEANARSPDGAAAEAGDFVS